MASGVIGRTALVIRRIVQVLALATLGILLLPGSASAHAGLVSSSPEPEATLGSTPGQVTLTFSEPLNTKLSRASVLTPDGSATAGEVTADDQLTVDLATNQTGVYEVTWTTVSLVDGHTLSGSFAFGVGVSPGAGATGAVGDEPTGRDLLIALARLVEDTSMLLVVGLLLLGWLARRPPVIEWVRTPILPAFVVALAGGVVVVFGEALVAASSGTIGDVVSYLTTGLPGWARLDRVGLEIAGVLVAWRWPRRSAPLVVGALVALAAAGHAAAVDPRTWGIVVEAIHLLSAAVWAGGILALALQHPPGGWLQGEGRSLLDRFTPAALIAFAITATTGVIRAFQEVGSLTALFGSIYGVVLVAKIAAVILMVQLSYFAWRRIGVFPRAETSFAVVAIAAAALLSAFPLPPQRAAEAEAAEEAVPASPQPSPIPAAGALTLGSHAGAVLVAMTIEPGKPGRNEITFYLQSLDGPQATAALPVRATADGTPIALSQCSDTCRRGNVRLRGGEKIAADVGSASGGRALFTIPSLPAPSGTELLDAALSRMATITSYRLEETLTAGLGTSVDTTAAFDAPNSFASVTRQPGSMGQIVWIGNTRYLRNDHGSWQVENGAAAPHVPTYVWDSFRPYENVRIVGTASLEGVQTTEVAFAGGDPDLPIWFRLWIDASGLVHRAEMRAPGHFMDDRYSDFDAPIAIEPPQGAGGAG